MDNAKSVSDRSLSKRKVLLCLVFSFFSLFWISPLTNNSPGIGVDPSMIIGYHWGNMLGLQFGKEIILTYGPLYFLGGPINWLNNESMSMLLNIYKPVYIYGNILLVVLWFITLFLISIKILERLNFSDLRNRILSLIVILITIFMFLYMPIMLPDILLILSLFLLVGITLGEYNKSEDNILVIFTALLLSIISLIKFSFAIGAFVLIVLFLAESIVSKKIVRAVLLPTSFIGFLFIIWLALGQSPLNIIYYFKNGFLISGDYSENVTRIPQGYAHYLIIFALAVFILWTIFLIFGVFKKDRTIVIYFLFSYPLLFLMFKEGFVRPDEGHYPLYFKFIIMLFILAIIFTLKKFWKFILIFIFLIILAVPFSGKGYDFNLKNKFTNNTREIVDFTKDIKQKYDDEFRDRIDNDKSFLIGEYPINENIIKAVVDDDTVDIFPFYVFIPYIYDFNWDPRPVFQSYVVFNNNLDNINASHFSDSDAPDKIIYKIFNYEDKYQIFDEPLVFQELIKNYKFIYCDDSDGWALLDKSKVQNNLEMETVSGIKSEFGEIIELPEVHDGYLFCSLDIDLNTLGKMQKLFYKSNELYIIFYFTDTNREPVKMRFYRGNGPNGFFISDYIESIWDMKEIFEKQYYSMTGGGNIRAIEITTEYEEYYDNEIGIEFFKLKFPDLKEKEDLNKFIFTREDSGRLRINVDHVQENKKYSGEIIIEGWAIDTVDVDYEGIINILLFDGPDRKEEAYLGRAFYYLLRSDVANYFDIDEYNLSGFRFLLDTGVLEEGQHDIYIYALNEDGVYSKNILKINIEK